MARLQAGGVGEWRDIVARKLAVEGRLLSHSAWACPTVGRPGEPALADAAALADEKPLLGAGLIAVVACLAVNDAGTVAAALCLSLLWGWVVGRERRKKPAA